VRSDAKQLRAQGTLRVRSEVLFQSSSSQIGTKVFIEWVVNGSGLSPITDRYSMSEANLGRWMVSKDDLVT